jgi:hypothetical protein
MNIIFIGILFGVIAGIIDLIPMFIQRLSIDAKSSTFSLWVVSGFLIATSTISLPGYLKGIIISFLVLLPSSIIISWKKPKMLVPIFIMTLILGALLGFVISLF